jgi:hypothetical protein
MTDAEAQGASGVVEFGMLATRYSLPATFSFGGQGTKALVVA